MSLHTTIEQDDILGFELLLRQGVDIDEVNEQGATALSVACRKYDKYFINRLLTAGASAGIYETVDQSPLYCLLHTRHINTNLDYMSTEDYLGIFRSLLKSGADLVDLADKREFVQFLSIVRRMQDVRYIHILREAGIDLTQEDLAVFLKHGVDNEDYIRDVLSVEGLKPYSRLIYTLGISPLAHAYILKNYPGVYDLHIKDNVGRTPLLYLMQHGHHESAEVFIAAGADPEHTDARGCNFYDYLFMYSKRNTTQLYDMYGSYKHKDVITREEVEAFWNLDVELEDLDIPAAERHQICSNILRNKIELLDGPHTFEDVCKLLYFLTNTSVKRAEYLSIILGCLNEVIDSANIDISPLLLEIQKSAQSQIITLNVIGECFSSNPHVSDHIQIVPSTRESTRLSSLLHQKNAPEINR